MKRRGSGGWRRGAAAAGSALCAWVAVDALLNSGAVSGTAADLAFLWLWGAPFAVASVFLAWLAGSGHRPRAWTGARTGCMGAAVAGGAAFAAVLMARLLTGFSPLNGIVDGLRWSPAAAAVGLIVTMALIRRRGRRSSERRPPES